MKKLFLCSAALLSFLFMSCNDDPQNARIEVWLTDDPGDYQEVNIDLQGVEVHANNTDSENGWTAVEATTGIYNLLELANGEETLLGDLSLPAGKLSQIRLKLGENNTIKVNDEVFPLATPSAQQSGLKVQLHQTLNEGITYKILLDFDAAKSVVETGNSTYSLKPVIRAITAAQDGAIKGIVSPASVVSIALMSGAETVTTTSSTEDGAFRIQGLEAGTYTLVFDGPGDGPKIEKTDVAVVLGEVTDVGTVSVAE